MLFPASTIATLRDINRDNLPHRAVVERATYTRGQGGVSTESFAAIATGVPCRRSIAGHSAGERLIADQLQAVVQSVVVFDAGTDVRALDRLTVTGLDGAGNPFSITLDVQSVLDPVAAEAMRKALCSHAVVADTAVQ